MKALVLVTSGLHLGYIGCYGNQWVATPALDRIAAEGVVFDQHIADHPSAAGARRAFHTGCYSFPLPKGTGGQANEFCEADSILLNEIGVFTRVLQTRSMDEIIDTLDTLSAHSQWLLRIELDSLLPPWAPVDSDESNENATQDDCSSLRQNYAAAVSDFDQELGTLLDELEQRSMPEPLFLMVTTARGQSLGEHAISPPAPMCLHEELIHIPLLMRFPDKALAGNRVSALTQPIDLLPTLLNVFGIAPSGVHGHSLLPLVRGKIDQVRPYAASGLSTEAGAAWALRTPACSLVVPAGARPEDAPRLYVKPDDRWEINDVRQHHLDWTEYLHRLLHEFVEVTRKPGPLMPPDLRDESSVVGATPGLPDRSEPSKPPQ